MIYSIEYRNASYMVYITIIDNISYYDFSLIANRYRVLVKVKEQNLTTQAGPAAAVPAAVPAARPVVVCDLAVPLKHSSAALPSSGARYGGSVEAPPAARPAALAAAVAAALAAARPALPPLVSAIWRFGWFPNSCSRLGAVHLAVPKHETVVSFELWNSKT